MRIYVKDRSPDLRTGLLGVLLAALDAEPSDLWLVSPWLREIALPIADHGHFASVFGGHRDEARLSELLERLARRHAVHLIAKPPDELVPLDVVRRIGELLDDRDLLLRDAEAREYETVERALTALGDEVAALGRDVTRHGETLRMLTGLAELGVDVAVLPNLHAKLLWTPAGAILGSANFTYGGFAVNEELMVEVSVGGQLEELRATAERFRERAVRLAAYSLGPALRRFGLGGARFHALVARVAAEPALHEVAALLEAIAPRKGVR
jgi:hypothetical protein